MRRWMLVALALVAAALAAPAGASADGDPASDVLLTENVFLPFAPTVSPALARALEATVARAHAAGYPIKLALIESRMDLGADPELFGSPARYARFLDTEITYNSAPPLLVVMPQGFGIASTSAVSALSSVSIDAGMRSDGLARAAIGAIVVLAARAGHPILAPKLPSAPGASGGDVPWAALGAGVAIVLMLAAAAMLRRRRAPAAV